MFQVKLSGTAERMGRQHGEILKRVSVQLPPLKPELKELANGCEQILQDIAPEYYVETMALAEAAKLNGSHLMSLLLASPLEHTIPSCSVIAVMGERSLTNKTMVGRNYDWLFNPAKYSSATYHTRPEKHYAHIGNCDWWIGREDGMNEHGLFVAMSATFLPGVQPGLPFWFIVRLLLERCTNVDEAVTLLESIPHAQSRNYMLADENKAVVVEATIDNLTIRTPHNGILTMTNHPVTPVLQQQASFIPDDSFTRYTCLTDFGVEKELISEEVLKATMKNREAGIWAEHPFHGQPYGTIWSLFALPADRKIDILAGDNTGTYSHYSL